MLPFLIGGLLGLAVMETAEKVNEANEKARVAKVIADGANNLVRDAKNSMETSHKNMTGTLKELAATKLNIMNGNLNTYADIAGKIRAELAAHGDTKNLRSFDENGLNAKLLDEMKTLSEGAIKMIATPEDASVGTTSLFAINTAATIGCAALFGAPILALPIMMIYTSSKCDEAQAAITDAATQYDRAELYAERCKKSRAAFDAITKHSRQLNLLLIKLNTYFDPAVVRLKNAAQTYGYDYAKYPRDAQMILFNSVVFAETIKNLISISMINKDGSVNGDVRRTLKHGQKLLDQKSGIRM